MFRNFKTPLLSIAAVALLAVGCTSTTSTETLTEGPIQDSCTNGKCTDSFAGTPIGSCSAKQRQQIDALMMLCPSSVAWIQANSTPTPTPAPTASRQVDGELNVTADAGTIEKFGSDAVTFRTVSNRPVEVVHSASVDTAVVHFQGLHQAPAKGLYELRAGSAGQEVVFPDADRILIELPVGVRGGNS